MIRITSARLMPISSYVLRHSGFGSIFNRAHIRPRVPEQLRLCSTTANEISNKWKNSSVVSITAFNLEKELLRSTLPTLLVFYSDMHSVSKKFMLRTKDSVIKRNEGVNSVQLRLATVCVEHEQALARQFQADRLGLPLTYLLYKGQMMDRLTGDLAVATIDKAIDTFLKVIVEKFGSEQEEKTDSCDEGTSGENHPLSHVNEAKKMLEATEVNLTLVDATIDNALKQCEKPIESFKKSIGFGHKRVSSEMINKMRENAYMKCMAKATGLRVTVALRRGDMTSAIEHVKRIRAEYPWALKDDRALAHEVVQVELSEIADYDAKKHDQAYFDLSYSSENYDHQLTVACRKATYHFSIGENEQCINVLLELIKTDLKSKNTGSSQSKARQMILKTFEALGSDSDLVHKTRKTLSRYLFC